MNLTIKSDRRITIKLEFKFRDVPNYWSADFATTDKTQNSTTVAIPGRRAIEVENIRMSYATEKGVEEITIFPELDSHGELAEITVYSDGRDYWTHKLRQMALEADPNG